MPGSSDEQGNYSEINCDVTGSVNCRHYKNTFIIPWRHVAEEFYPFTQADAEHITG